MNNSTIKAIHANGKVWVSFDDYQELAMGEDEKIRELQEEVLYQRKSATAFCKQSQEKNEVIYNLKSQLQTLTDSYNLLLEENANQLALLEQHSLHSVKQQSQLEDAINLIEFYASRGVSHPKAAREFLAKLNNSANKHE